MEAEKTKIHETPSILWGSASDKMDLSIHGQHGCKEEAESFAEIVCQNGLQVLSIDLPEHGARKNEADACVPWHVVPELMSVMEYAKNRWTKILLYANSVGAWFSMLSDPDEKIDGCLFVSPVLDMERLIAKMMLWANVSEARLERELLIPASFGQTLSWEYLQYAKKHPVTKWDVPTNILYGGNDNMIDRDTVEAFAHRFDCKLSIVGNGEHRLAGHQIDVLNAWAKNSLIEERGMTI
jgi:alpha-beta hydrolase superfamily lysophospholipase